MAEAVRVHNSLELRTPVVSLPDLRHGHTGLVVCLQGPDRGGAGGDQHHHLLPAGGLGLLHLLRQDLGVGLTGDLLGDKGQVLCPVRCEILH